MNQGFVKANKVFPLEGGRLSKRTYAAVGFNWLPFKNYNRINIWFSLALLLVLAQLTSCDKDDDFTGSQRLTTEIRQVDVFTRLKNTGVFDVTITQGASQSVEITANDNIMGRVKTDVVNGQLKLELSDGNYKDITVTANIVVEQLNGLENSGVGSIVASNIDSNNFTVSNSGDAEITISGIANKLDCFNEGAGDVHGFDFSVNEAELEIIGSGSIEINCANTLDAKINGSGDIFYKGDPSVQSEIKGSGEIIKVED